jgi:hypothetical protein
MMCNMNMKYSNAYMRFNFIYLFIYDLFNNGVISLDYIVSNDTMISELERMYMEVIME